MRTARTSIPVVAGALVACLALLSPTAFAQGIQSAADGPREGEEIKGDTGVAEINEVERGFYLSVDAGLNHYLHMNQGGFVRLGRPLFGEPANPTTWFSPGTRMGVRAGYDILNNLNADLFLLANFNEGIVDQGEISQGLLTGDLSNFVVGIGARFAFLTLPTDYPRFFVYARGSAGYGLWFPAELAQNSIGSIHVDGSLGVEYYTKLRHLSVGVEATFQALLLPMAFGVQIYPTVKYTF
jgi:hypothetical protein